jgi:hypothetical protein
MRVCPIVLVLFSSLVLGACATPSPNADGGSTESDLQPSEAQGSSLSLEELALSVRQVVPSCEFDSIRVANDAPLGPEVSAGWDYLNVVPLVDIWADEDFGSVEDKSERVQLLDGDTQGYSTLGACHSRGRSLESLGELGRDFGLTDSEGNQYVPAESSASCWRPWGSDAPPSFVQGCLDDMSWDDNQGFWVVFREHSSPDAAIEHIRRLESEGSSLIAPIFSSGQFTLKMVANWNTLSSVGFFETNNIWFQLQETLPNTFVSSSLTADYAEWTSDHDKPRELYREWASVYGPTSSCSESLEVSEVDWSPLECGITTVDVFQADLATGSCAFLGDYVDKNGATKIGYFQFCETFEEGSFSEGNRHELRVRVVGQTSYQARGGWEQNVLAFDVVG